MTDDKRMRFAVPKYAETPGFRTAMAEVVERQQREAAQKRAAWLRAQLDLLGITPEEMARDYYIEQGHITIRGEPEIVDGHYVVHSTWPMRLVKRPPFVDEGTGI